MFFFGAKDYKRILRWTQTMSYITFKCPNCNERFADPKQLQEHSVKVHKGHNRNGKVS